MEMLNKLKVEGVEAESAVGVSEEGTGVESCVLTHLGK